MVVDRGSVGRRQAALLILADEPTSNLHSNQAREIMELFRRLNDAGTSIVQVTNDGWTVKQEHKPKRVAITYIPLL